MPQLNRSVFYLSASLSAFASLATPWLMVPAAIAQVPSSQPIAPVTSTQSFSQAESASDLSSAQPLTSVQRQLLEAAIEAAEQVKQQELLSGNLVEVANAYNRLGDTTSSQELLARADFLASGNSYDMVHVAEAYIAIGDLDKAEQLLQAAIAAVDRTVANDRLTVRSSSLATIADAYAILPDDNKRSQGLAKILDSKSDPFEPSRANSYLLGRIVAAYGQMQNAGQAKEGLNHISKIALDHIGLVQSGQLSEEIATSASDSDLNDPVQVNVLIEASLTHYVSLLNELSVAYRQQGELAAAKDHLDLALEINATVPDRYIYAGGISLNMWRLLDLAQEYAQFDELAVSNQLLKDAGEIATENENPYTWIEAQGIVAATYYEINELAQAQTVLVEANNYSQALLAEADSLESERLAYLVMGNLAEAYEKVGDVSNQRRAFFQSIDGMISIMERLEAGSGLASEMSQEERDSFTRHTFRRLMQRYSDVALADENSDRIIKLERLAKSSLLSDRRLESLYHLTVAAAHQGDRETADRLAQDLLQTVISQPRLRQPDVRSAAKAFSLLSDSEAAYAMLQTIHQQLDAMPIKSVGNLSYQRLVKAYLDVL